MSNEARRERAFAILNAYQDFDEVESVKDGATLEQVYADLLSDLRHAAASQGIDFDSVLSVSQMHFEAEQVA